MYGKDWRAMIPLIKTRSLRQIRTHAQKVLKSMYAKRNVSQPQPMDVDGKTNSEDTEGTDCIAAVNTDNNSEVDVDHTRQADSG